MYRKQYPRFAADWAAEARLAMAIVLGIGGDNSDFGIGTFYEGAMTANYTTDATDNAVHANIVAAGYGR